MAELVTSKQYSQSVVDSILRARQRVYVLALIVQQSRDTSAIINALNLASHRGVDVRVMMDFSTYAYLNGFFRPSSIHAGKSRYATDMVNRLQTSGVTCQWLGQYQPFFFAGRTHSKWIIADNEVFSFGGINLQSRFSDERDYMFHLRDSRSADILSDIHHSIARVDRHEAYLRSSQIPTERGTILIDGGLPGDSVIYRRAIELAKQAKHILITTQYCPTGRLASIIKKTAHQAYFNEPTQANSLTRALIWFGKNRTGIKNSYRYQPYIHAKYMVFTLDNDKKVAITGSHNFISYGGLLGTREVALETSDAEIIEQIEAYNEKYIA